MAEHTLVYKISYTDNSKDGAPTYFLTDLEGNYITADSMLAHGNKYVTTVVAPN